MTHPQPVKQGFSRTQRILRSAEFASIREQGERVVRGCVIANWVRRPDRAFSRLGAVTSRRIGKATVRNRARRLMRESFRRLSPQLECPLDLILVARHSIRRKSQSEMQTDLESILRRQRLLKASPLPPPCP